MSTPMDKLLDAVKWTPVEVCKPADNPDNLPTVTHEGILTIGDRKLRCYQLSSGQRIIDAKDLEDFFSGL